MDRERILETALDLLLQKRIVDETERQFEKQYYLKLAEAKLSLMEARKCMQRAISELEALYR